VFFARQTRVLLLSGCVDLKMSLQEFDREVLPVLFFHLANGFQN
jgi:hypothetical protein